MKSNLENIVWDSLSRAQRHWCIGDENVLRYAPGFSPIVAFPDPASPDLNALLEISQAGESLYCDRWEGPIPERWELVAEKRMKKLILEGASPTIDPAPEALRLTSKHIEAALELAGLTSPGPFGPRTIELGEYFGIFDGEHLIAMAGERFHSGQLREVSAICTIDRGNND